MTPVLSPLVNERPVPGHHPRPVDAVRRLARALLIVYLALGPFATAAAQDTAAPTDPAALAARQVERGEQWFRSACLQCHAIGAVSNPDFRLKWGGRTAQDLFDLISRTMPDGDPGSLSRGAYLAITAYLLKLNGMPVASAPLAADSTALGGVRLAFPATPR
ncbi:MAG: cytochrome c [Gemmatimonadetes bacterium]|nr:cytochrome c [Gemmatimonadota bacterium]